MMKGRADDRRLLERGVKLNVMALVDSTGFDAERLAQRVKLADYGLVDSDLTELKRLFEHASTFGSLIQVPEGLAVKLPALKQLSEATSQDLFVSDALTHLAVLVRQTERLTAQYEAVAVNPPYMGSKGMNTLVKKFAKDQFPDAKSDLFACFIERGYTLAKDAGYNAMVTMQSWMFLSSFEKMREWMLREKTIVTMAHLGPRAFGSISGEVVQTTACVLQNRTPQGYNPVFFRLLDGGEAEKQTALANGEKRFDTTAQDEFKKIPGSPVAYWVSERVRDQFESNAPFETFAKPRIGMRTGDNDKFLRRWFEVSLGNANYEAADASDAEDSGKKWFPYQKGGTFRKWSGNHEYVVNWYNDGFEIKSETLKNYPQLSWDKLGWKISNENLYFKKSLTWTATSSSYFAARLSDFGCLFDVKGSFAVPLDGHIYSCLAFLCSPVTQYLVQCLNPTIETQPHDLAILPYYNDGVAQKIWVINDVADFLVRTAASDWDAYERSWDFESLPILMTSSDTTDTLESSYTAWITQNRDTITEMKRLEEENNRLFIDAYGLTDELTPGVPIEQITLTVNPAYRYGGKLTKEDQWARFCQDTMAELVSYAIGCMMGRYSLDAPGLIYAHSGGVGFNPSRYITFPADPDGIVPLTDSDWFEDDAAHRLIEFISVAWDATHLEDNLAFLASNLLTKQNEPSREALRRYLCDRFFKDHLQTYKKRPIYWFFSSGKQKAFQCLVYLHRYNESTLARMRTEYVIPLQGMMTSRIRQLDEDIAAVASTAHRKRLEKERAALVKQKPELLEFDEKLRHYADQRIGLDLDDGVKVNYGKFGDLLAEVKTVTGAKAD